MLYIVHALKCIPYRKVLRNVETSRLSPRQYAIFFTVGTGTIKAIARAKENSAFQPLGASYSKKSAPGVLPGAEVRGIVLFRVQIFTPACPWHGQPEHKPDRG